MDTESGVVVAVEDVNRAWTFDLRRNVWTEGRMSGAPPLGWVRGVVYDQASDRTYAFGENQVSAYDADRDTWATVGTAPGGTRLSFDAASRTVYLLSLDGELTAYNLATRRSSVLEQANAGPLHLRDMQMGDALTVFDDASRRILVKTLYSQDDPPPTFTGWAVVNETWTFDPASHRWAHIPTATPSQNYGWFASGGEMVYDRRSARTVAFSDCSLATFNSRTGTWTTVESYEPGVCVGPRARLGHALVDDVTNGRILLIGGNVRDSSAPDGWRPATDVWSYDIPTSTWTLISSGSTR